MAAEVTTLSSSYVYLGGPSVTIAVPSADYGILVYVEANIWTGNAANPAVLTLDDSLGLFPRVGLLQSSAVLSERRASSPNSNTGIVVGPVLSSPLFLSSRNAAGDDLSGTRTLRLLSNCSGGVTAHFSQQVLTAIIV